MKSYYEILEINPNATKDEIKKQYHKLVRKYHPDVNSSVQAEEIFKQINNASKVLLDDEKRKIYDSLRKNINSVNTQNKTKSTRTSSKYSFDDLFGKSKKRNKEETKPKPKKGDDITMEVTIDTYEAIFGTHRVVNIVNSTICPKCKGYKFSSGQKCSVCNGKGEITSSKKITVKIPEMIKNKTKLRLKNEGKNGINGGENGNLYIIVNIKSDKDFTIKNNIVYYNAYINPYTAILGGEVPIKTLWGEAAIKIPPLTKCNQEFKLVNVGVLNELTKKKGDEIIRIIIQTPKDITDEEIRLYEKIKEINLKKNAKY